jgi:hypothetical protein
MSAYQAVAEEPLLAAIDERSQGEPWGPRRTESEEVGKAAPSDLASLKYLVFDGVELVAAFAMRADAELWIEECGNGAMTLRNARTMIRTAKSKSGQAKKSSQQSAGLVSRGR